MMPAGASGKIAPGRGLELAVATVAIVVAAGGIALTFWSAAWPGTLIALVLALVVAGAGMVAASRVPATRKSLDQARWTADQTRLLALNAAIESARAGEPGRATNIAAAQVDGLVARVRELARESAGSVEGPTLPGCVDRPDLLRRDLNVAVRRLRT